MNPLNKYTAEYLSYCEYRKRLFKTLKSYRIDLSQYSVFCNNSVDFLSRNTPELYITELHKHYKSKSVKRKIASLKAFFHYLEYADLLVQNPFDKLDVHFREAKLLPKTIPFHSIQKFLSVLYAQKNQAASTYQLRCCLRIFFVNKQKHKSSDQSVRFMIKRYTHMSSAMQKDIMVNNHPRNFMVVKEG